MKPKTIKEIREALERTKYLVDIDFIQELEADKRAGVKALLERIYRRRDEIERQKEQWDQMTAFESRLWQDGSALVAGIDEVGRGPLAGPVVSAAVILPSNFYLPGLNDSKQLTQEQRRQYFEIIQRRAIAIGIALISNEIIDEINILNATKLAMKQAIAQLEPQPDYILIDALTLDIDVPQTGIIGGDSKSVSIAAASVIAKVTRDQWMQEAALLYPGYGFERNAGYPTKEHRDAIANIGVTPIHRRSFAGVKEYVEGNLFVGIN